MEGRLKEQFMAELSRRNIDLVTDWILEKPDVISSVVKLSLSHNEESSWRAAWALEKVSERAKEPLADYIETIINELHKIKLSGTRRIISKILMLHTIPENSEGKILDFCLSMIELPKEPVAVKANCMTIIFNLLPKYPELKNEIFAIIEDQIPHNSVAFKSRFGVLKKKLKQT